MSSESPAAVLFDSSGNALAVQNATPIPANTPAILIAGTDGVNSLYELLDGYGRQIVVGPAAAGSAPVGAPLFAGGSVTVTSPTYIDGTVNALSLTTSGLLRIDGSSVVQPVSGTVTANQGSPNTLANAWPVEITDGYNILGTVANPVNVTGTFVTNKASTSTVTSIPAATSNTVILASNNARVLCSIFNNASKPMFIKLGATASLASFSIQLMTGSYWEPPQDWTGEVDAVWAAGAAGNALVTEMTP